MKHIESCAVGKFNKICPTPHELSKGTNHWWSGWPGAYCMGCGIEDANEICIGTCCQCKCHEEFWKLYEEACQHD